MDSAQRKITKNGLVVISVDFGKLYDSVKIKELTEVMKYCKIHPQIVVVVEEIYIKKILEVYML